MAQRIHDISRVISNDALVFPGDDQVGLSTLCDIGPDCPCKITRFDNWTSHFLTHVDAPRHFHLDGKTLDDIELTRWLGRTRVFDVPGDQIDGDFVKGLEIDQGVNVLFRSRHSGPLLKGQFDENHVHITRSGAEALVEAGTNLVGVDYLSVDRFGDDEFPAHRTLLGQDVLILEATDLRDVRPGEYDLIALPLKVHEGDGSPVRAVLSAR